MDRLSLQLLDCTRAQSESTPDFIEQLGDSYAHKIKELFNQHLLVRLLHSTLLHQEASLPLTQAPLRDSYSVSAREELLAALVDAVERHLTQSDIGGALDSLRADLRREYKLGARGVPDDDRQRHDGGDRLLLPRAHRVAPVRRPRRHLRQGGHHARAPRRVGARRRLGRCWQSTRDWLAELAECRRLAGARQSGDADVELERRAHAQDAPTHALLRPLDAAEIDHQLMKTSCSCG